jgi:CRISPR-associated protein Csx14
MKIPEPSFSIHVDVTNPGQFFACCGLLELAHRLWPGSEGWFSPNRSIFLVSYQNGESLDDLIRHLTKAALTGALSATLLQEREELENEKRQQQNLSGELTEQKEGRRVELGKLLREGSILVGAPFDLRLDWWQEDEDGVPKTWAGSQQVLRIANAALSYAALAFNTDKPFDFKCVMRPGGDEEANRVRNLRPKKTKEEKVEPFYFDSRHGANALPLDIGFSPNELGMESKAFPAVELLCLIGLQRCRPVPTDTSLVYRYFPWHVPLPVVVLPAAVCGHIGQSSGLLFENAYRTDQRKHKGYRPATPFTR